MGWCNGCDVASSLYASRVEHQLNERQLKSGRIATNKKIEIITIEQYSHKESEGWVGSVFFSSDPERQFRKIRWGREQQGKL